MTDPTIVTLDQLRSDFDRHFALDAVDAATKRLEKIPHHYRDATAEHPEVEQWVRRLVWAAVCTSRTEAITVSQGPSLLLLGPTGTGKTHQAYGAIRALAATGVHHRWEFVTAADAYARLRPRPRVDSEDELRRLVTVPLLVLDDLGAAKATEWTEEVNYRLINHRYEHELPTLITSNVPIRQLSEALGDRVSSRLAEMTTRAVLDGGDRRRPTSTPEGRS